MLRPLIIAALILPTIPAVAGAQVARVAEAPPKRIRSLTLNPGQKCPPNTKDEIVVCSTLEQPYRIPPALRDEDGPKKAANQSWVNRAAQVDQASRVAGGLPDTCSANGTGGQTGCALQANQQWVQAEKARRAEANAGTSTTTTP